MATRHEILRELNLAPQWRRRNAQHPGGDGTSIPEHAVEVVEAAAQGSANPSVLTTADQQARIVRIATLDWTNFADDVDACNACGLGNQRRCSVPGVGDPHAEWMFVGEAPGAEEDAKGEPFVGQAGRLLDNMLAAIDLKRGQGVYIANVVKCRPPSNRNPEAREMDCCEPYLARQIELIQPKLIVA